MRTSPPREKSGDLKDEGADEHQKAPRARAVKSELDLAADYIQTTVAANGRCTGDGAIPNAIGMVVDPQDQLSSIR